MRVPDGRIFDLPEREARAAIPALESNKSPLPPRPPLDPPVEPLPLPEHEPMASPEPVRAVAQPNGRPPEPARSRKRQFVLAGLALAAIAAGVAGIVFAFAGGNEKSTTPPPLTTTSTPTGPTARDPLRASIPSGVRATCNARVPLKAPGGVLPAFLTDTVACRPRHGVSFAQYSLSPSKPELNKYFNGRINARHVGANKTTPTICGPVGPASPEVGPWIPSENAGHRATTTQNGFGRVFCYWQPKTPHWRIEWIDTSHRIYVFASGNNWDALFRWWQRTAGPTPAGRALSAPS
jgi:hypothetical protein